MSVELDTLEITIQSRAEQASTGIDKLTNALAKLKSVAKGGAGLTAVTNQLNKLSSALSGININAGKMGELANALNKLADVQKASGLSSTVNALKKLPDITKQLDATDLGAFAKQMERVAAAVKPLADEMQKVSNGFSAFPIRIQKIIQSNEGLALSNNKAAKSFGVLGTGISAAKAKFGIYLLAFRKLTSVMSGWVQESNDYVENLNLFTVAMGDYAQQAKEYAELVQQSLGIDPSEWMRNQGIFKQITSGFGVVEDKANLMSKALTQIGYDISSFFNISIEESMQKVQSGISGELEPLRRLGYALDQATLQQIAYNHGITQNISTMTQAQKSQLRFVAIMEQSKNVMGDMARTVMTPANAMRILQQQVTQLARALGNILIPIITTLLPYVQAFVMVLTEAAQFIANLLGFELPTIDYSGSDFSGISQGADTATDSLENATDAAKKLKQYTLGFDELNIIAPVENASAGTGTGGIGGDLGLDLSGYDYDFLGEFENKAKEIAENIKKFFKDWEGAIKSVGAALLAAFAAKKLIGGINNLINGLKNLKNNGISGVTKAIVGTAGLVAAFAGAQNAAIEFSKILDGEGNLGSALVSLGVSVAGIGAAFWAWGIPGAIVGTVTALVGAFYGLWQYQNELTQKLMSESFYDGLGVSIEALTSKVTAAIEPTAQFTNEMLALSEQSDQYQISLGEIANGLNGYINDVMQAGTVTAEQAQHIREQIDLLVQNLREKLEVDSNQIFQTFAYLSQQTAQNLGMSVSEMSGILEDFQQRFGDTTQQTQNRIDEILNQVTESGWTDELRAEMENLYGYLSEVAANSSELVQQYRSSLSEAGDIDFIDADATKAALESMLTSASDALGELDRLRDQELANLDTMKQNLEAMLEYGFISSEEYQEKMAGFMQIEGALTKAFDAQKAGIQQEVSSVMGQIAQNAGEEFKKEVMNQAPAFLEGLQGMVDIPASTLEAIYNDLSRDAENVIYRPIMDVLDKFQDEESLSFLYDTGSDLVNGLTQGVENTKQTYIDSINQMAEDGILSYKGLLGIESPSTVFYDFGYNTVLGLRNGILENTQLAVEAISSMAEQMIGASSNMSQSISQSLKDSILQAVQSLSADPAWSQNIMNTLLSSIFTPGGTSSMSGGMMGSYGSASGGQYAAYIEPFSQSLLATMNEILPPKMQQGAMQAIEGFVSGIEMYTILATDAMNVLVTGEKGILATFDKAMDARSYPSKEMEKRGLWAMQGLQQSIEDNTPLVTGQIQVLSDEILRMMDNLVSSVNARVQSILAAVERAKSAIAELSSLSVSSSVRVSGSVRGYASGGYPTTGQMFLARENGPELVGTMGGRTAVVNNDQIVESVALGVYEAMVSAMNRQSEQGQQATITILLDGEQIYQSQEEIRRSKGFSFGMGAFAR